MIKITLLSHPQSHNLLGVYKQLKSVTNILVSKIVDENDFISKYGQFNPDKTVFYCFPPFKRCDVSAGFDLNNFEYPDVIVALDEDIPMDLDGLMEAILYGENYKLVESSVLLDPPVLPPVVENPAYEFKKYHDTARDWMFYQVQRPDKARYFTVIVRDYASNGMEPFFAWIYADGDWGLFRDDQNFLQALWTEYMEGPFDLEEVIHQWAQQDEPMNGLPNIPPQVHDKSIMELVDPEDVYTMAQIETI